MARIDLSELRFVKGSSVDRRTGLLGYVSFLLNRSIRVDGVTLRRTAEGRLTLSYPARQDREGREHPYFRPIDDDARREIERQAFIAIASMEEAQIDA